jgi:hypothetical protein
MGWDLDLYLDSDLDSDQIISALALARINSFFISSQLNSITSGSDVPLLAGARGALSGDGWRLSWAEWARAREEGRGFASPMGLRPTHWA